MICELLSIDKCSVILDILTEPNRLPCFESIDPLLRDVYRSIEAHRIVRNITDWPFENFWTNPHEPKHSKLLGYFIDPHNDHGCGRFLLIKLFDVLRRLKCFPFDKDLQIDACRVTVEDAHIDILITCDCDEAKYAVIIENKVNSAVDQKNQLERYVREVMGRGFLPSDIWVFYLPLTAAKDPDSSDKAAIINLGANYQIITFVEHVMTWLNEVLDEQSMWEQKLSTRIEMRENLSHYRNLLRYLNKQDKIRKMKMEIIDKLRQAYNNGELPSLEQVQNLRESTVALQECLESTLRVELLLRTQRILEEKMNLVTFLSSNDESTEDTKRYSRFDARMHEPKLTLHVRIEDSQAVTVCVGIDPNNNYSPFWLGYGKRGNQDEQQKLLDVVMQESQSRLKRIDTDDPGFYNYAYYKPANHDICLLEETAVNLAEELSRMHDGMQEAIRKHNIE